MQLAWLATGRQTNFWNFKQQTMSSTPYLFGEDSWTRYLLYLLETYGVPEQSHLKQYNTVLT